ncbi:MAG TPA: M20/M25/M40 family metallo-hydrolase [Pyrinomonadaceae bacterium]|nr:M20/M25/M40 family metallo-hydrolase [Pyrinomonadaceae bacterium]
MFRRRLRAALLCSLLFAHLPARAQQPQPSPTPDPNDPVQRIRDEGLNRSQIMQTLSYLTDVIGPRLTGSPGMKRANEWTRDRLTGWGLQNARLEAWGPFGRGWTLRRFSAEVVEPQAIPLVAFPKAWSPGTDGPLVAEVVYVGARNEQELEKFRGMLRGRVVLNGPVREVKAHFTPEAERLTEKELLDLANASDPATRPPRQSRASSPDFRQQLAFAARKLTFFQEEGAALVVDPSRAGDGGNIFVQSATVPQPARSAAAPADGETRGARAWDVNAPKFAPQLVLSIEQYNRLARMIQAGERVRVSVNLEVQFHGEDLMGYNTVADIPGTDLKDEVVMVGGHLDSWHGATGATDNAAGVAVAMEAVRIIKALGLQPRRTIRVALWSGEEQGVYGSKAYVEQHFGRLVTPSPTPAPTPGPPEAAADKPVSPEPTPAPAQATIVTKPEYERFSVYFNLDNGTGRIRGVYMQGNEAARPLFSRWLAPFADTGAQTLTLSNTGGTDHLPFDAIGLPGFQFIQDEIEYSTRTHHSTQDVFDRIQADDMKQAASVMAAFAYQAAMLDTRFPRKPVRAVIKSEAALRAEEETSAAPPAVKKPEGRRPRVGSASRRRP